MAMKPVNRILAVLGVLLAIHVALTLVGRSNTNAEGDTKPVAGIVFDVGGRGDKSFNDGAYNGALRAQKELGVGIRLIEPGDGSDREAGIRLLAAEGMKLIVGVGFIFTDDLTQLATEYPDVNFAGVDYALQV